MTIRTATAQDALAIAELSDVLGYPTSAGAVTSRLVRLLGQPGELVLVAELPLTGVVGWIHASRQELIESGRHCEILGLVIAAEHRKLGIGRRLVEMVEAWACEQDLEHVSVRSNITRKESHPFYERIGFSRAKTQHVYRKQCRRS